MIIFREHALAHKLLDGLSGLEIGAAAHNPFGLNARNVAPIDDHEHYAQHQAADMGVTPAAVDIWATADAIPAAAGSEDFVLSSHVVEHLPNVVAAFLEWDRIVRVGGFVFMIVPRRDALPADVGRPLTTLDHLIDDYERRHTLDTHPVDDVPGGRMGHYHVFTPEVIVQLVAWMKRQGLCDWELVAREDVDTKVGNGFTLAFQIVSKPRSAIGDAPRPAVASRLPARLRRLEDQLRIAEQLIADQAGRLVQQEEKLAAAEARAQESDRTAEDLRRLFEAERDHLGWWFLQACRAVRDRLCPRGGWRWKLYAAARGPLRWLLRPSTRAKLARLLARCNFLRQGAGPSRQELRRMRERMRGFRHAPLISLIVPVYNVDEVWLRAMVDSVRRQVYPHWELCLVNDGSTAPHVRPALDRLAALDTRLRVRHLDRNAGISGASNRCLELATGEFCAMLDHDDELTPDALFEVAAALDADPALDVIYSDEDKISAGGTCYDPVLKPDWNPALLLTCNYVSHLGVYRTALLREVGGFRSEFDGSQDYDVLLRCTERTRNVAHIPKVLYHWRVIESSTASSASAKPYAYAAARRSIEEALRRRGSPADVETRSPGQYRVHAPVPANTSVALVVHWPERTDAAQRALEQLLRDTERARASEVVLVSPDATKLSRVRLLSRPEGEPIGKSLNAAAFRARGEFLAFLEAGVQPLQADWLAALLEQMRDGVVAAGARIVGPTGRLLHSGLVLDDGHPPESSHTFLTTPSINRTLYAEATRNCSAVGRGCLLVRRAAFEAAGGFDERFRRSHHDIDLCLRLRARGGQIVYTPWAVMQQATPEAEWPALCLEDRRLFEATWQGKIPRRDPFFHHRVSRRSAA